MLKRTLLPITLFMMLVSISYAQQNQSDSDLKFGMELYQNKMYDLAEEQFTKFLQEYPASTSAGQARYYLAMSQYQENKFGSAAANFQAFAVQYPNDPLAPKAWLTAGESYAKVKDYMNAALSYQRFRVFYPTDVKAPGALLKAAKYFELAGDTARAEESLVAIVQNYTTTSSYFGATLWLGNLYFLSGELSKAEDQYKALLTSDDDSVRVMGLLALGKVDRLRGRPQQAEAFLQDAADLNIAPQSFDAMLESIEIDLSAGSYTLADRQAAMIDTTELSQPQKEWLLFEKAYSRIALGNQSSYPASTLNTLPLKYRVRLAHLLNTTGRYNAGISILGNLAENESTESILRLYSELAFRAGRMRLADSLLTIAIGESKPVDVRLVVKLLEIENRYLNDPEKIRETFYRYENVLKQRPDLYDFYKARSEEEVGDYEAAIRDFEGLTAEYPESDYAGAADSLSRYDKNYKVVNYRDAVVTMADILLEQGSADRISALFHLGNLYENELKDYSKAARVYKQLASISAGDTERVAEFKYAEALEKMPGDGRGESSQAYPIYQQLSTGLQKDSVAERSLLRLADMQALSGDSLAAEGSALSFLKRFPASQETPRAYTILAESLYGSGAYHEAMAQGILAGNRPEAQLIVARAEIALDSLRDAQQTLQVFIGANPPKKYWLEGSMLYAHVLQKMGKDAVPTYSGMLEQLQPSHYKDEVAAHLANYLYATGRYDSAYTVYKSIGEDELWYSKPPSILYKMAYCKLNSGDLDNAKDLFQEVATTSADSSRVLESYYQLGNIYATLGDREMSASFYERAGSSMPDALVKAADIYFALKDYADAARVYGEEVSEASSDTLRAYSAARLVDIDYLGGNLKTADLDAARFRRTYQDPGGKYWARFLVDKAEYFIHGKNYAEAERLLADVGRNYKKTPAYPRSLLDEARISVALGELDVAEQRLKSLIAKFPDADAAPEAHLELGNIYYAKQKYQDAADNFRAVYLDSLAEQTLVRDAMSRLISSYESVGMYDAALDITRKFIKMFPEDKSIMDKRIQVGILYEELRYFDQALLTFKGLIKEANRDYQAELHYYVGAIYDDKGEYANAILEFLKVPYLVRRNAVVDWAAQSYYMAGKCYEKLNKPNEAIAMYEKIVHKPNTDPTFIAGAEREINRVKALLK